MSFVLTATKLL